MRSILFAAAFLVTESAFAQVQVVSQLALATLDRIDVDHIVTRPTETARIVTNRSKLLPDGSPDTLAPGIGELFAVVDSVPTYSQRPVPKKQAPTPATVRAPAVRYTYSSGSCVNGSCGPGRSYGRFRLFGRRR